ncbi:MAG: caspase family protein [Lewinellaceae bacterium]|nr:caspase family protein [Lewinellaceae bacterium]
MATQNKGTGFDPEAMSAPHGKNHLLVIAIDEYAHCPKLNNCVKDASEFIEVLTGRFQFEPGNVTTLYNSEATRANILSRLNELKHKVRSEDNLVIYFSGHGETEDDVGYWVPVAANPEHNWEFVSTYDIKSRLDPIPSFHTFVIVDACFSGSLFTTYKAVKAGYETKCSRLGLAASHSRERALDGTAGDNSPFAAKLLKKLRESPEDLGVQRLATDVIEEVQAATRGRQTPVFKTLDVRGDDSGQYVFHLKANEAADWKACQETGTVAAYRAFLVKYPEGMYAQAAKATLSELEEETAWEEAKAANTILSYYQYNQRYPSGKHRVDALEAIEWLEEEQAWQEAGSPGSLSFFLKYKERYPQGRFTAEAEEQIQAILARQQEPAAWRTAKGTNTLAAYEAYLQEYPEGAHALEARAVMQQLEQEAQEIERRKEEKKAKEKKKKQEEERLREQAATEECRRIEAQQQESTAWQGAQQTNTIESYEAFLRQYPQSLYAQEARMVIQQLRLKVEEAKRKKEAEEAREEEKKWKEKQLREQKVKEERHQKEAQQQESFWDRLFRRWTNMVPVEKEEDILFDHEYDGIRELDNALPPWWVALFTITIAFGVAYYSYYHITGLGGSSAEEYKMEMEQADKAVQAFLSTQSNQVDETNVEQFTDEQSLAAGKTIFEGKGGCFTCHGMQGEGGIGPNMTDPYWIHGGDIKDIFRTIKYGVPEKGMISWKGHLKPSEMHQVASYILSLQGTNPSNPKEPQGELYQQVDNAAPSDSNATGAETQKTDAIDINEE